MLIFVATAIMFSVIFLILIQLQSATETLREQEAKLKENEEEHSSDLENSLIRLEEEQQRLDVKFTYSSIHT